MTIKYAAPEVTYIMWGKDAAGMPDPTSDTEPTVTCDKHFWNTQSFSDSNKNSLQKIRGLGAGRDLVCVRNGRFETNFTVEANLTDEDEAMELVLGSLTSKTALASNTLPYFATEIGYKDYSGNMKRVKFYGCKVNNAKFSFSKSGEPVKVSLDIFAQRYWNTDVLQTSSVSSNECPFVGYEGTFNFGGTTMVGLQDATIEINHTLSKIEDTRSRFVSAFKEGPREFNISGSIYYSTSTSNTAIAIQEAFMGDSGKIIGTSTPVASSIGVAFSHTSLSSVTFNFPASSYYVEDCSAPIDIGGETAVMKFSGFATGITSIVMVN